MNIFLYINNNNFNFLFKYIILLNYIIYIMTTPIGYKFLDTDGIVKDFADVFVASYPSPGITTGYTAQTILYGNLDLGKIFTAGSSNKTTNYKYLTNNDLGSIFVAQWSPLTSGVNSGVSALAIDSSNNVYVGGAFTTAGGISASRIAKWTPGTNSWSALITGGNNGTSNFVQVIAINSSTGEVYVGGDFTTAGGVLVNNIAKWTPGTNTWSTLGAGTNNTVYAITIDASNNDVYVGGVFTTAGGSAANRVAKWTPGTNTWSSLGINAANGTNNTVYDIAIVNSANIYVGGLFTTAGGNPANYIAKWSGSSWSALINGVANGTNNFVYDIAIVDSTNIYVGGNFTTAGAITANRIAKWNGTNTWSSLGSGTDNTVETISIDSSNNIYVGGFFITAGGSAANRVAKWNPLTNAWSSLGIGSDNGTDNVIRSIAINSNNIYVGGDFTSAGGNAASYVAKYTSS